MYKIDFNEVCQNVPFHVLLTKLNIPFTRAGNTLKTDEIIVTEQKAEKEAYKFDLFKWKDQKGGGSILDYAMVKLNLKTKTKTAEYLKSFVLGENVQKEAIPNLKMGYCDFLKDIGISEKTASEYEVGLVNGKSVMAGRVCFKLYDHTQKHRGYIGYDHSEKKKIKWFVPNGTKTSDLLYNYNRRNGNDYCLLTGNPLEAIYLIEIGFPYTVGMITATLTPEQLELMKVFKRVIIIAPATTSLTIALSSVCFTKQVMTQVIGKTHEEIRKTF